MNYLTYLHTFLGVYRAGSVGGAAEQLNVSQPTASGHLKALETQLGRALFERRGRGIEPTAAAHDLARTVQGPLDSLETAYRAARVGTGDLAGTLRLGGPAEFLSVAVLPSLKGLDEVGIRLRVRLGVAAGLVEALADGELELAIATQRLRNPAVGYRAVYREELTLVAAPRVADRIGKGRVARQGLAALEDEPWIAYGEGLPIIRRYCRSAFRREPRQSAAITVPDLRGVAQAAAAGAGITVLPKYLCREMLESGRLVALHQPPTPPSNTLYIAWNRNTVRLPRNAFVRQRLLEAAKGW